MIAIRAMLVVTALGLGSSPALAVRSAAVSGRCAQHVQIVPEGSQAVLLGAATKRGRLQLGALGLGNGGIPAVRVGVRRPRAPSRRAPGRVRTPGGVLVRAQREGVKLDFATGRELLITPSGRVHLRSGEQTLPFFRGVRLVLADGAVVTAIRGTSSRRGLSSVSVEVGGRSQRIWSGSRRVVNASHGRAFLGSTLLVLGDGGALYRATTAGPVVALERVLCPKDRRSRLPERRVCIVGDVIAASLRLLPEHAPRKSVQFPQVAEAARRFAALGPLFQKHTWRLPGAVGELWFELPDRFRLKLATTERGVLVLGLYKQGSVIPGVEWNVASRTTIHFVRPDGGQRGGPRYFMRGIDLRDLVDPLLPVPRTANVRKRVAQVVTGLGGRIPRVLDVKHVGARKRQ